MRSEILVAVGLAIFLSGCATQYGDIGLTGGVAAQQVTADTFRIVSRGNAYTSSATVQDYTLLKAAETTKMAGATHFAIVQSQNASTATQHISGNRYFMTASTSVKPGADTYIKVMTLPPGSATPPDAYNAEEIISFIGSRVERPQR